MKGLRGAGLGVWGKGLVPPWVLFMLGLQGQVLGGHFCPTLLLSQEFPQEGAIGSQLISISSEGCSTLGFGLVMLPPEQYLLFLPCLIFVC